MRVGVDVGGTNTRGIAILSDGTTVESTSRRTGYGAEALVASVLETIDELRHVTGAPSTEIGIGVPGLVDTEAGVVRHVGNLGVAHLELGRCVQRLTRASVVVDNDVNAATLAAMRHICADPSMTPRSFAYVNIGTGLRVGFTVNGQLLRGRSAHAGELGHFQLGLTDRRCGCGQRGCIETSTSGHALARYSPNGGADAPLPPDFLRGLVAVLRMTTLAADPSHIVLGGGVALNRDGFLEETRSALREDAAAGSFLSQLRIEDRLSIAPSTRLGVIGAALLPGALPTPMEVSLG